MHVSILIALFIGIIYLFAVRSIKEFKTNIVLYGVNKYDTMDICNQKAGLIPQQTKNLIMYHNFVGTNDKVIIGTATRPFEIKHIVEVLRQNIKLPIETDDIERFVTSNMDTISIENMFGGAQGILCDIATSKGASIKHNRCNERGDVIPPVEVDAEGNNIFVKLAKLIFISGNNQQGESVYKWGVFFVYLDTR